MKKSYVKPQVYFENFQLSANIASGCGKPLNHTKEACQPISGMNLFLIADNCDCTPDDAGLCYQSATDGTRLFTS